MARQQRSNGWRKRSAERRRDHGCEVCAGALGCGLTAEVYKCGRWWCAPAAMRHGARRRNCTHGGYHAGRCGWCGQVIE